ncbi:unnamed protein product, partial [Rotaria magnacalcarata]
MIDDLNDRELIPKQILDDPSYNDLACQPEYRLSECRFDGDDHLCPSKFNLFDNIFDEL